MFEHKKPHHSGVEKSEALSEGTKEKDHENTDMVTKIQLMILAVKQGRKARNCCVGVALKLG